MIEIRNVTKRFGTFRALDDLTMTVPSGAVYGLVGPNGAGKSTIIRHIVGIFRQDSGTITVDGAPVYENPEVKAQIAYIPDDIFYFAAANLADMKKFYAGIYPNFSEEVYQRLVRLFGLNEKIALRRFSKGMQRQAAFILAISIRPKLMVLDEPVDGLDPMMRHTVWSLLMQDVAEHGTTVLISSHNLRELEDVCDWVGILQKGKVLLERPLSELQDNLIKVQAVFQPGTELPADFPVLSRSENGKIETLILRSNQEDANAMLAALNPVFYDLIPLTLEEIFIYELGGADYDFKEILS